MAWRWRDLSVGLYVTLLEFNLWRCFRFRAFLDDSSYIRPDWVPVTGRFRECNDGFVIPWQGLKVFQHGLALPRARTHDDWNYTQLHFPATLQQFGLFLFLDETRRQVICADQQ